MKYTDKYVFFYGDCFSNWAFGSFTAKAIDGNTYTYNCSEQALMHNKALCFGDLHTAEKIMLAEHPREQKTLGRKVNGYKDDVWNAVRFEVMVMILVRKFACSPSFFKTLMSVTPQQIIVEASPYDTIWGIGLGLDSPDLENETKWRGTNLLGEALMKTREVLELGTSHDLDVYTHGVSDVYYDGICQVLSDLEDADCR
jgi:ribA/ribD-fused uncharacterized protein